MSVSNHIIEAENICKYVQSPAGQLNILNNISFSIQAAESVAILGVSGSGKSTLLGILAGLDTASSGRVLLEGKDINTMNEDERAQLRKENIGFVFQSFQLLASMNALENVMLPLELSDIDDPINMARARLNDVGLSDREKHYPHQLSGGEQQRVAIARAFACQPKILFADEPTGNLDQKTANHIIELLFELNQEQQTTLVLVTHDPALAEHCDRKLILAGGQLQNST